MTGATLTISNAQVFDGTALKPDQTVHVEHGTIVQVDKGTVAPPQGRVLDLRNDILSPGFVDLQVNGGGGVMFNDDPSVETLKIMADAHWRLGVVTFLPTLITDTPNKTRDAINAVQDAIRIGVPGIAGLHLEGPHLSIARKGAHDPHLIRVMETEDLNLLLSAARDVACLKVTLAPESVTEDQVAALAQAGALVSLGHSDATYNTCQRYFTAGASYATHLFNAMSQLGSREPGLVGAAIGNPGVSAGLIADLIHVHPETIRTAWKAKAGHEKMFLVSDAMAVAGTDQSGFTLGSRQIERRNKRLTLADGTLAGADLDLLTAARNLVQTVGIDLPEALAAATRVPAELIGLKQANGIEGRPLSEMITLSEDLRTVRTFGDDADSDWLREASH